MERNSLGQFVRGGSNAWNKGKKCPQISKSKLGTIPWNKGLKGYKGAEEHYNWKGGITSLNERIRKSTTGD